MTTNLIAGDSSNSKDVNRTVSCGRIPCYYIIESLGVPDPPHVGQHQGPGDEYWTSDFFATSQPIGPMPAFLTLILPTESVWTVASRVVGGCSKLNRDISQMRPQLPNDNSRSTGGDLKCKSHKTEKNVIISSLINTRNSHDEKYKYLHQVPWMIEPNAVRHETHAGLVSWDGIAVVYHYKGQFEPW
eukprot:CAMPEP_0182426520 /NCGR_PEP_ID=MMETSP1167-20130531/13015_1 /TAXON_ID=2988 /ORGANISM="Mallomonas Sp, Strain CCMP3275" /LENGTH=186 /DNA_ID=CAMNT_0024608005 /DNA_START=349 /DNA_END=906 /DNA_ORIENTATION=+